MIFSNNQSYIDIHLCGECHDLVFSSVGDIHDVIGVNTDANSVFKLQVNNGVEMFIMFVFDHYMSDSMYTAHLLLSVAMLHECARTGKKYLRKGLLHGAWQCECEWE